MNIPVFFTPKMVAQFEDFSPSAGKPVKVVDSWNKLNIPIVIIEPKPATTQEISLAHDPAYVQDILACRKPNGFHNMLRIVAESLPYTVGSMICAAREAIHNEKVAVAPCSGFHHASYKYNAGFCTFNGLVVAARVMLNEGLAKKVGIVDFDMHYGDGTDQIIGELNLKDNIEHYTAGAKFYSAGQGEKFLYFIPKIMNLMEGCDVILYQAGADPHINDPFGGWLTTEQLSLRDRLVFLEAKRLKIPIAWNLAGGYQQDNDGGIRPVLEIHDNTMKECYEVYR